MSLFLTINEGHACVEANSIFRHRRQDDCRIALVSGADRTLGATTVCWELFVFTDNTFALRAISKNPLSSRIGCCSDPTIPCQPHDHRLLAHLLSRELITTEEYDVLRNGGTLPSEKQTG